MHRCSSRIVLSVQVLAVAGLLLACFLVGDQPASARRCHRVKSANGKVYCCVYRLPDEDIPFSLYMLSPTAVKRDLEYLVRGYADSSRQQQLQVKIYENTARDHLIYVDDVTELSGIFQEKNEAECVFRCTDLLINLVGNTDSGINVAALKESSLDTIVASSQRRIDDAEIFFSQGKYSEALVDLDAVIGLKDTDSPAAARLDWPKVVSRLKALRPYVKPIQQVLVDHEIFKVNYVEKLVPLTPEVRALFTQNVTPKDAPRPAQVP